MAGGSHTNFDEGAFTVGTLGAVTTLASAVGQGLSNYRARRDAERMAAAVEASERLRRMERQASMRKDRIIDALRVQNARMTNGCTIAQAREMLRRR